MSTRDPLCVCGCPQSDHSPWCTRDYLTPKGNKGRCSCKGFREAIAQLSHKKRPTQAEPPATERPERRPARSSQERFDRFHAENPHVYQLFKRFTFEAIKSGRERFSARTVIHRIRWYTTVETEDPQGFKINNNWSPFYARMFVRDHPGHDSFFEVRTAIADRQSGGTSDGTDPA